MQKVDVAIIGAGTAGLSARREVEKLTDNYLVIDDGPLGTTCARVGCMPSKALIEVANTFHHRHKFDEVGIHGAQALEIDQTEVMNHVRKLRDRFVRSVMSGMQDWRETKLVQGRARFVDANTLEVNGQTIKAKNIILATGSKPVIPQQWKAYEKYFLTTEEFFELKSLPKKVAVVGLGVIGIEIGQALSRLGVEVFGFTIDKAIGGLSDPALQDYAAKTFSAEFNISYNGVELVGERDGQLLVRSEDGERLVDKIFLTMGRAPSLKGLGLENLGLETDQRGLPKFDPNTFLIPNTRIFLVGDANGERNILHEAADEGRIAGYNAVRADSECFQRRTLLAITFSDPNIAIVGKGYRELKAKNIDFIVGKVSYEGFGRAIIMLKEKGLVHIYGDKKSGRILGAEIIAPSGEHLAHLLSWVISLGLSAHDVLALPFYHPVLEEGLRSALRDLARQLQSAPPGLEVLRCQDPPAGTQV